MLAVFVNCGAVILGSIIGLLFSKKFSDELSDYRYYLNMAKSETKDVFAFEKMKEYHGVYHVLNGYISPSKGKGYDDINLSSLITRIENNQINEIILATDLTMEGEITAMYISKLLSKFENLKITRLAHGLPMGAQLDYADEMTLFRAFSNRKQVE